MNAQDFDVFFENNYGKPDTPEKQVVKLVFAEVISKWEVFESVYSTSKPKTKISEYFVKSAAAFDPDNQRLVTVRDKREFSRNAGWIQYDIERGKYISIGHDYKQNSADIMNWTEGAERMVKNGDWEIHDWPDDIPVNVF